MAVWGFYFLAKVYFHYLGVLKLDVPLNLAFGLYLLIPMPKAIRGWKVFYATKLFVEILVAFLLVWRDSWFAPLMDTIFAMNQQGGLPSPQYVLEFIIRWLVSWKLYLAYMLGGIILCHFVGRAINLVPVGMVVTAMIIPINLYFHPSSETADIEATADIFYTTEMDRVVKFEKPTSGKADFDLLFIHICSLGWDDLRVLNSKDNKFLKQFHFLFSNFNGVTSYSYPSLIRLMHATCGQRSWDKMDSNLPRACYLFDALSDAGFETYTALNHNGKYSDFAEAIKKSGHIARPMLDQEGLPVEEAYMFYASPIYSNYAVLEKWWNYRLSQPLDVPAALYYNTVSLHDGSHWVNDEDWWKRDPHVQYDSLLTKLLNDVQKFLDLLASSGRNVVVVFIPEHGRALGGSMMQPAGIRDIPLPQVTYLPVAIKLIGPKYNDIKVRQVHIDKPTSYLAVSYLLSYYVEHSPFAAETIGHAALAKKVPETKFMTDNWEMRVMEDSGKYYFFGKDRKWMQLSQKQLE